MKRTTSIPIVPSLALAGSLLLSSLGFAGPVDKNAIGKGVVQVAEAHPMYLGSINSGIKTNDAYTDGNFSIVAPVWSSLGADATLSGGVLFLEPYISYGEGGEVAASLGLGYRHLFGTQSVSALTNHDGHQAGFFEEGAFIGANMFVDMLDTDSNNQFWQLGVGLEAGTRYVELRGNYYIPLSDRQLAEERRTRETFRTSSTSSSVSGGSTVTPLSDPFATGNTVSQDALFSSTSTRITRTTTTTTTVERLFQRFEEGMEGWDAEIAVLVPGIDRYMDVMLIGGYYSFDNQPFGPQEGGTGNVEGWKAGVEIRPVPAIILTGTWYEDERLTGGDWTVGVQMQIPFEAGDLGDGKNFWSRIGESFKPRRRHLAERLAEPVARQNAAVKIANSFEESQEVVSQTTSTKVKRSTRVLSQSAQRLVLADDVVFVNNGGAVGNGIQAGDTQANGANGTAERPFNGIVEGAATAGTNANGSGRTWTVYTQGGTGIDYTGVATATGSTKFVSSFTPIVALTGHAFGGNTARPIVSTGRITASAIPFLQVTGYDFRGTAGSNSVTATNVQNLIVSDNFFVPAGTAAVQITVSQANLVAQASVTGNRFTGQVNNPPLFVNASGTAHLTIDVAGNEFNGSYINGISLNAPFTGGTIVATVRDNTLRGTYSGFGISAAAGNTGNVHVDAYNNTLSGTFVAGIRYSATGSGVVSGTAQGNVLDGTFTDGVLLTTTGTATLNTTVTGNELSGTFTNGIHATKQGSSTLTAHTLGNTLSGTFTSKGIRYFGDGGVTAGLIAGTVKDNVLSGTFVDGIELAAAPAKMGTDEAPLTVQGNNLSGAFTNGIIVRRGTSFFPADITVDILGNQLGGAFSADGISIISQGGSGLSAAPTDATIANNQLTGDFGRGIVLTDRGGRIDAVVSNNLLATGSTYATYGIFVQAATSFGHIVITQFDGNLLRGDTPTGMRLEQSGTLSVNGTLNNEVSNESGNKVEVLNSPTGQFLLNGNPVILPTTVP